MSSRPNIFSFGTSELTQDAMLSWLFAWADPEHAAEDPELHRLGCSLLALALARGGGNDLPNQFGHLKVRQQVHKIDILVEADEFTLLVEDKVGSTEHSDQLARYLAHLVAGGRDRHRIAPVYIQTHEQADYTGVEAAGYKVIRRRELLDLLEAYRDAGGEDGVVREIHGYLDDLEVRYSAFWTLPGDKWTEEAWQGFFTKLQEVFTDGSWLKVNNASDPFWAFHWGEQGDDQVSCYMQIEEEALAYKISVTDKDQGSRWRDHWHEEVMSAARRMDRDVHRPQRFGHGQCMTVAFWSGDYRKFKASGELDLEGTIAELQAAANVLDVATGLI